MALNNDCPAKNIGSGGGEAEQNADKNRAHVRLARIIPEEFTTETQRHRENQEGISLCLCASVVNLSRVPYMHDVPVLHNIVFAFESQGSFRASVCFRSRFQQLVPTDGFGANEMFFQIRMDCPSRFLRARARRNLPGAA